MSIGKTGKVIGLLLAGAWLPVTITCDPGEFDAVISMVGDHRRADHVLAIDTYWDQWWDYGCCDGLAFDFAYDD